MWLIDAGAVYKILESCEIRKATIGNPLTDWEYGYTCGIERAESEIECAPTLDAVPVVRCEQCTWWNMGECMFWAGDGMYTECHDYCSRGQEKGERMSKFDAEPKWIPCSERLPENG